MFDTVDHNILLERLDNWVRLFWDGTQMVQVGLGDMSKNSYRYFLTDLRYTVISVFCIWIKQIK